METKTTRYAILLETGKFVGVHHDNEMVYHFQAGPNVAELYPTKEAAKGEINPKTNSICIDKGHYSFIDIKVKDIVPVELNFKIK